jgi:hypothetical protein
MTAVTTAAVVEAAVGGGGRPDGPSTPTRDQGSSTRIPTFTQFGLIHIIFLVLFSLSSNS